MKDMYKQAVKQIPFLRNRKKRMEYVDKLKMIPFSKLREMKSPMDVLNYISTPTQSMGYSAADLGETLIRQNIYEPKKEFYQSSRM